MFTHRDFEEKKIPTYLAPLAQNIKVARARRASCTAGCRHADSAYFLKCMCWRVVWGNCSIKYKHLTHTCNNKAKTLQRKVFRTTFKTSDSPKKNKDIKYSSISILQQYALDAFVIGPIFWSQAKRMQSKQCFFCQYNRISRAARTVGRREELNFRQFWCFHHRVCLLQEPPPCALVIIGAAVSLCIAMRCTEVVSTSRAQKGVYE